MPAYVVRELTCESELTHVARLRTDWAVGKGLAAADPAVFLAEVTQWWRRQGDGRHLWLTWSGERPVAMANLAVFERMPRPGRPRARWGYVGNLWVDVEHRRRGVASSLMSHVIDWGRAQQMERIILNPSAMSRPLYVSLGFRPADDLLRLDLPAPHEAPARCSAVTAIPGTAGEHS